MSRCVVVFALQVRLLTPAQYGASLPRTVRCFSRHNQSPADLLKRADCSRSLRATIEHHGSNIFHKGHMGHFLRFCSVQSSDALQRCATAAALTGRWWHHAWEERSNFGALECAIGGTKTGQVGPLVRLVPRMSERAFSTNKESCKSKTSAFSEMTEIGAALRKLSPSLAEAQSDVPDSKFRRKLCAVLQGTAKANSLARRKDLLLFIAEQWRDLLAADDRKQAHNSDEQLSADYYARLIPLADALVLISTPTRDCAK